MSKLSELLNPVPSSNAQGSPVGSLNHDAPDDPQDQTSKTLILTQVQAGSPNHNPALESPLEALANAATSSTPLVSPTHPLPPLTSFGAPFQNHPSSRPTSSRISPPLPIELSHQPEHPHGAFSPGLEQYHHTSSHEVKARRLSDIADGTSRTLPPLRRSLPNESIQTAIPLPLEQYQDGMSNLRENLPMKLEHESDIADDPHAILLGPSKSSRSLSSTQSKNIQPGEVEVKAEAMETSEVLQSDTQNDGGGEQGEIDIKASRRSSLATELALPRNVLDMRHDRNYQLSLNVTETSTPDTSANSKPATSRKRAAPKPKVEKKGTASTVKPPGKRRKIEAENVNGTPPLHRSGTPVSSRASKTPAPRNQKQKSATPARSSSVVMRNEFEEEEEEEEEEEDDDEDDDDDEENNELFCTCRKPDDHTWMIACDGPCQDWFHGRCVGIDEKDGNLIDKYICPNCKTNGDSQTTWKPMCRLETCRDPARVTGNKPSKYCSDEHGVEYMRNHALKGEPEEIRVGGSKTSNNKKRKRNNNTDSENIENDAEVDDTPSYLRGGILRTAELKALASSVNDIAEFRKLGEGVLSPPRTASPDGDLKMEDANSASTKPKIRVSYSTEESDQLDEIVTKLDALKVRKSLLGDREKLLGLVKARAKFILEELRKRDTELKKKDTIKDICGYDARLSWSDEDFKHWRSSPEGQKALSSGVLGPPATSVTLAHQADISEPFEVIASPILEEPKSEDAAAGDDDEFGKGTCQKRHCARHRAWWKLHQQEMAFEKEEVRQGMRRLEEEEKGVRDRAMIRCLEGGSTDIDVEL